MSIQWSDAGCDGSAVELALFKTTCRLEECLAKLRSQAALQNYLNILTFRPGQLDAIMPVQHDAI